MWVLVQFVQSLLQGFRTKSLGKFSKSLGFPIRVTLNYQGFCSFYSSRSELCSRVFLLSEHQDLNFVLGFLFFLIIKTCSKYSSFSGFHFYFINLEFGQQNTLLSLMQEECKRFSCEESCGDCKLASILKQTPGDELVTVCSTASGGHLSLC